MTKPPCGREKMPDRTIVIHENWSNTIKPFTVYLYATDTQYKSTQIFILPILLIIIPMAKRFSLRVPATFSHISFQPKKVTLPPTWAKKQQLTPHCSVTRSRALYIHKER